MAARGLAGYLATKGARIEWLWLPDDGDKTGLDDYLAEHTVDELWRLVKPVQPPTKTQTVDDTGTNRHADAPKAAPVQPVSLDDAHAVFKKWLGKDYDTDAPRSGKSTTAIGSAMSAPKVAAPFPGPAASPLSAP
jgi:hypothetical protein